MWFNLIIFLIFAGFVETKLDKTQYNDALRNNGYKHQNKIGMENRIIINQQNIPPATPTAASSIKRVLHRDDDILPFSNNSPDLFGKFTSSSNKSSKLQSNITKRHFAPASSSSNTANNYEEVGGIFAASTKSNKHEAAANNAEKPNRKIAVLTNSNLISSGFKFKGSNPIINSVNHLDYDEFMVDANSKSHAPYTVQSTANFAKSDPKGIYHYI